MSDSRRCGYCDGPLAEGYGSHQASDCVKYLHLSSSGFFKQVQEAFAELREVQAKQERKLDGLGEVLNHHGDFVADLRRSQDASGVGLNDKFKAVNKALIDHAKHLLRLREGQEELNRRMAGIELEGIEQARGSVRFQDQAAQEMLADSVSFVSRDRYDADILRAKQDGYNRGSADTRRRFVKLFKEGLGDDND